MHLDLEQTLCAAQAELNQLLQARAELDRRIAGLRLAIQGLRQMQGANASADFEPEGLTDSCRAVLRAATQPMSPPEVKAQLDSTGFDWSSYSSPISALHTVLKRLATRGQAVATEADGKMRYCWKEIRVVVARKEDIDNAARFEELINEIRLRGRQDRAAPPIARLESAGASPADRSAKRQSREKK